jgi:hypothetical protein
LNFTPEETMEPSAVISPSQAMEAVAGVPE